MVVARVIRRRALIVSVVAALMLTVLCPATGTSQTPETDRLVVSDVITPPSGTKSFGGRVALSGDGRTAAMVQLWSDRGSQRPGVVVTTLQDGGWVRTAELDPGVEVKDAALSDDGSVLAFTRSDPNPDGPVRVQVYARVGVQWRPQASWLLPDTEQDVRRIALSGDGTRMLVGAGSYPRPGRPAMSAWRRSGADWVSDRLPADLGAGEGFTLAMSADGSTALIGPAGQRRAPTVLRYSADGWTRVGPLPAPTDRTSRYDQMALSADGAVATIGSEQGEAAKVLRRDSRGDYRITGRFRAGSSSDLANFGHSMALSGDGNVLLVGAPGRSTSDTPRAGGVYRYLWTGSAWRWGGLLNLGDPRRQDLLGSSIAMSADGSTVLSATPYRRPDQDSDFVGSGMVVVYRPQ